MVKSVGTTRNRLWKKKIEILTLHSAAKKIACSIHCSTKTERISFCPRTVGVSSEERRCQQETLQLHVLSKTYQMACLQSASQVHPLHTIVFYEYHSAVPRKVRPAKRVHVYPYRNIYTQKDRHRHIHTYQSKYPQSQPGSAVQKLPGRAVQ